MSRLDRLRALEARLGPPRLILLAFEAPDPERDQAIQAGPREVLLIIYTGLPARGHRNHYHLRNTCRGLPPRGRGAGRSCSRDAIDHLGGDPHAV